MGGGVSGCRGETVGVVLVDSLVVEEESDEGRTGGREEGGEISIHEE